jgi:hypothetical protein
VSEVIPNTPFLAVYAIAKADIVVLAIYHAAQRWLEVSKAFGEIHRTKGVRWDGDSSLRRLRSE